MVEHWLPKPRVAGSSPVYRSMTPVLLILFLVGYVLIATEHLTRVNKSAVAMFLAVLGWIVIGADGFKNNMPFICNVAFFMLATMSIVEVLNANGCFDFLTTWMRQRSGRAALWSFVGFTFLLSANLDNLTTTIIMLYVMRKIVASRQQRMYIGSAIVIAANCGGCFTVIGDSTSLMLWSKHAVTPTNYAFALAIPALVATAIPTYLISLKLPHSLELVSLRSSFRGDDNVLGRWQRIMMFVVGVCGLWFIPTFHRLTDLPPFLGAFCVLAVFWVINEIINLRRMQCDLPEQRLLPRSLQYENMQIVLFFIGVALAVSVLEQSGVLADAAQWLDEYVHNVYAVSLALGLISAFMDNIALVMSTISMYPVVDAAAASTRYLEGFTVDGMYWNLVAYGASVGGCLLPIGTVAGYALMRHEEVSVWWWFRMISGKVLVGWLAGLVVYGIIEYFS